MSDKGTAVVLLAYDLDTGQRYTQMRKQRTKADYAEFMHAIVRLIMLMLSTLIWFKII